MVGEFAALMNLGNFFSPHGLSPVTSGLRPGVSAMAVDVTLFHDSGCRLVHKYRIYRDPIPHPALREVVVKG